MDLGSGVYAPLSGITDDNHAGVVIVFVIISALFSISFALIRFLLSAKKKLGFWYDDLFISLSLVCIYHIWARLIRKLILKIFTILFAVLLAQATHYGLGKHISSIDEHDIASFFKVRCGLRHSRMESNRCQIIHVNRIVAVFSLSFAKYSLALLYRRLDIYQSKRLHNALLFTITIFMLFGLFAVAFQCGVPWPKELTAVQCTSGREILGAVAAANFITDLILVIYPFYGISKLTMATSLKITVLALFASRLL
jgi:hypothetical protein